jgi:hypothetical protein
MAWCDAELPAAIVQRLRHEGAEPLTIARLGGMSQGRVYRVNTAHRSLIIKRTAGPTESTFYRQIVTHWPEQTRHTPALPWALESDGVCWLALEDIPHPLPPHRLADPDLLMILHRLHRCTFPAGAETALAYRPVWSATLTDRALRALASDRTARLGQRLTRWREAAPTLFIRQGPISGDPNPANWGVRDDDTLVLFDWERLCLGTPAIDLAITVPGLGGTADYRQVAARYLALDQKQHQGAIADLERAIALAKVWSVVEFLAHNTDATERTAATIDWLKRDFEGWFERLWAEYATP